MLNFENHCFNLSCLLYLLPLIFNTQIRKLTLCKQCFNFKILANYQEGGFLLGLSIISVTAFFSPPPCLSLETSRAQLLRRCDLSRHTNNGDFFFLTIYLAAQVLVTAHGIFTVARGHLSSCMRCSSLVMMSNRTTLSLH